MDDSSLVCIPTVFSVDEFYPMIGVVGTDEFDGDVTLFPRINVIPSVRASVSLVFKICVLCDVCWEIVCLSPVNSFVFVSEFSDEDYCRQSVLVFVLCLKDVQGKPDLC